ncbi:MAG: hypothetical protein MI725_10335 [Pirellulales bacterium]|nr:hypothetical protein [Pirellulales bacterium]
MTTLHRWTAAALVLTVGVAAQVVFAQEIVTGADGNRYQVTRRVTQRQVPVTEMQDRSETVYTQQLTTNTINHQQLYCVPTTSYQWDTRLRGRWNPFVTPYWTYNLRPVTTWSTQVANVQIPINQVAWVPQTRIVQVPVTTYRTAEVEETTRVALNDSRTLSRAKPLSGTATIAARPGTTTSTPLGGVALENDPPRQATGWQNPNSSRYR